MIAELAISQTSLRINIAQGSRHRCCMLWRRRSGSAATLHSRCIEAQWLWKMSPQLLEKCTL